MADTQWTCPFCETNNVDDPDFTAVPHCEGCQKDVWWEETTLGQHDMPIEKYAGKPLLFMIAAMDVGDRLGKAYSQGADPATFKQLKQQMDKITELTDALDTEDNDGR